jgi:Phosphotransferase enzyme family
MSTGATKHPRHPNQRDVASLPAELRRTTVPPAVRAWVERNAGVRIARVRRLAGASSTAVHGLYTTDGTRLVLRRYVWPGFLAAEPVAPRREVDALRFGAAHGLPVPEVVAADTTGVEIGDGVPALLMGFLPGRAVPAPDAGRLAEVGILENGPSLWTPAQVAASEPYLASAVAAQVALPPAPEPNMRRLPRP